MTDQNGANEREETRMRAENDNDWPWEGQPGGGDNPGKGPAWPPWAEPRLAR